MKVIGLTGSVGMGKSTVAAMLRRHLLPVFDADRIVHDLLRGNGHLGRAAVAEIAALFPLSLESSQDGGKINRAILGKIVFAEPEKLRQLEKILHPKVEILRQKFLRLHRRQRRRLVVLDMPLLFETHKQHLCDVIMVVHAPDFIQAQRVLARPGMTPERLAAIRRQQLSSQAKCRLADVVLPTGLGKVFTMRRLKKFWPALTTARRAATTARR
ncbi:MAG: dephospho-CoA kinase [Candidatus Symbiobacter sp.]|nr:dephospho-CoA kinase [Candidatus Symbiobacter sp.]